MWHVGIKEPRQLFEQEHSGCVGNDLFDILVQRVAILKLWVHDGDDICFGRVKIKIGMDTFRFTNVMLAGLRQCRYLAREGNMFIKYEAKVASRFSSVYLSWRTQVTQSFLVYFTYECIANRIYQVQLFRYLYANNPVVKWRYLSIP